MKITDLQGTVKLNNGVDMPYFGLGVFESAEGNETKNAVLWALEAGYRHIDTAALYRNEKSVGEGVKESGLKREDIFITTKVWNSDQGYSKTLEAFKKSMDKLKMDYVDLYLVHWPVADKFIETWGALEELYQKKLVRAIGVSNFLIHHLEKLMGHSKIVPAINQMEFHPYLVQQELVDFCTNKSIRYEAWMPIMKGRVNQVPEIVSIGKKHGKSPFQVTLRWDLQKGVITIPKSVHKDRIISNADVFDFQLSDDEMKTIDSLEKNKRFGAHPDTFDF